MLWIRGDFSADQDPVLMTKIVKFYGCKILFIDLKLQFIKSPGLYKGRSIHTRSFQPSKENIYHFKTLKFLPTLFFIFVGHFCPPGSKSGSNRPKLMRILTQNTGLLGSLSYETLIKLRIDACLYLHLKRSSEQINKIFGTGAIFFLRRLSKRRFC